MPADQGDVERFAAADEQGRSPRSVGDPTLARDLEIAAMLRSTGNALAPTDDERARVRARVMAGLARGTAPGVPAHAETAPLTAVLRPPAPPPGGATAGNADDATTVLPVVAPHRDRDVQDAMPEARTTTTATPVPASARAGRRSRSGRHTLPTRPASRTHGTRRDVSPLRRALLAGAAALLAVVAVAGGSIAASRNALPGDALYGVKRAAESVGNAVTLDQTSKAQRNLESATTRLDEVQNLTERDPASSLDPQVVRSTMQDFDTSTSDGARTLLATQDTGSTGGLSELRTWASDQATKLSSLRGDLPAEAQPGADQTMTLLDRLIGRTEALSARTSCADVAAGSDDLGPLPATTPCASRPSTGGQQAATSAPGTARSPGVPGSAADPTVVPGSEPGVPGPGGTVLPVPPVDGGPTDGSGATATTAPAPTTTKPASPLPGLPPIYLPPLLPGGTGITIG